MKAMTEPPCFIGPGGRLGTNYLFSDRTTLYLNYALENERTDNGLRGGRQ